MELAENGQKPFALILCCSDSRVPPEILFDQGLGDLFVIRTAGNVLDEIGMGTVEYGAAHLHIPLIVVLGHEQCGAVHATLSGEEAHGCLKAVIEKIRPAMRQTADCTDAYEACTDANIQNTLEEIRENSVIEKLLSAGTLEVIGAKYQMRSGAVDFWE
jgi:carbonic anhydrase